MDLTILASTIAYILDDDGPYGLHAQRWYRRLIVTFRPVWLRYEPGEPLTYMGPEQVTVTRY